MEFNPKYENFDFSWDLKNLQASVLWNDLEKIKLISQNKNLDQAQKQYLQNHLWNFLNNFLQKAKADPNSYTWSSWQIIKDLNLQNFDNPQIQNLLTIANMSETDRKSALENFLKTTDSIKIFETNNFSNTFQTSPTLTSSVETQNDIFPTHFAIQKKQDWKNISLFWYSSSTPSVNKLLTPKQNDFIIWFNKILLEWKNQNIDREKFKILAQNYGLEKWDYTFFVENSLGAEPFINIAFWDNIWVSFWKNVLPAYENLISLAQHLWENQDSSANVSQTSATSNPIQNSNSTPIITPPTVSTSVPVTTTNSWAQNTVPQTSQAPQTASKPAVSPPTPDPKNYIKSPDPNLKNNFISEQKNSTPKTSTKTETQKTSLRPELEKDLIDIAKNSLTAIDLAKISESDILKPDWKK